MTVAGARLAEECSKKVPSRKMVLESNEVITVDLRKAIAVKQKVLSPNQPLMRSGSAILAKGSA
eukprot:11215169-Lingulodinium_polyedra.AAC.1